MQEFYISTKNLRIMEQIQKGPRNEGQKTGGKGQPTEEVANNPSSINYSSLYGDKEIVDCEPESPARYLCDKGDISPDYDYWPAHRNGSYTIIQSMTDFLAFLADDSNVRSRRRSQKFFQEGVVSGASECGAPEPGTPAEGEIIFPLQYSPHYYVIEEPEAPGKGRRASA